MTQIYTTLQVVCCFIVLSQAALIFDKCTSHDQCPSNARCRPTGCDGYTCRCDDKFVSSDDKTHCLPARKMAYSCSAKQGKCLSNFAVCEDNVCRCNSLMEPTPEGRCKDPEFSVLEESCQRNDCSGGTVCEAGTCVCPPHMRRLTTEEFWIDPMMTDYCIDKDFSVHFCNGSRIEIPPGLLTTPLPSTDPSPANGEPSSPGVFTKIVSLVQNEASIYEMCSRHEQCPEHAQCRPQGCKGFSCLCDEGYMASVDKKSCVKAARVNEPCNVDTSCLSPFAFCDGVCKCLDVFMPTKDGRCKLPDISFVGEECSTNECEYPATCVSGVCRCVGEYRAITAEEFWVDPTNIWQCAKNDSSPSLCNGMPVTLPTPMSPPIPVETMDSTTTSILSTSPRATGVQTTTPIATETTTTITTLAATTTTTAAAKTLTTTTTTTADVTTQINGGKESSTREVDVKSSGKTTVASLQEDNVTSMTRETTTGPSFQNSGTNMQPATTTLKSVQQKTELNASSSVAGSNGIKTDATTGSAQTTTTASVSTAVSRKTETPQRTTVSSQDTDRASITDTVSTASPVNADSRSTRVTEPSQNNDEAGIGSGTFPTGDNSMILTKTRIPPKGAKNQTTEDQLSKEPSSTGTEDRLESSTVSESYTEGKSVTSSLLDSKMESTTSELPTSKSSSAKATLMTKSTRDDANVISRETTQISLLETSPLIIGTTIRSMTIAQSTARPSSVSSAPTTQSAPETSHSTSASDHVVDGHLPTSSKETEDINLSRKIHKNAQNDSKSSTPKMSDGFLFGPEIHQHDHYLCESHSFHCSEVLCIPSSWVCDGERNCPDGRDEGLTICNKDRVCPADEYKCSNFRCIPGSWLCDGEEDCPKKEDESAAAGCFVPDLDPVTETVTFESIISMDTNTTGTNMTVVPGGPAIEPGEKSYTASAGLGSLESIAIAAAAGLVFLINVIGIILALTRRNRRKLDKKQPSTMSTSVTSSDDAESGSFKIPRPNVLYPPYYVKDDWNTWNSSHFTQYAEQMYAMDEHSDFYPGSLKTL